MSCDQISGAHSTGPQRAPVPRTTLFPVVSDGLLAPWRAQLGGDRQMESHVVHFTGSSQQEYELPLADQIFVRLATGIGAMTDGTNLVAFDLLTGAIKWTRAYPGGGARILVGTATNFVIALPNGIEEIDQSGRTVN